MVQATPDPAREDRRDILHSCKIIGAIVAAGIVNPAFVDTRIVGIKTKTKVFMPQSMPNFSVVRPAALSAKSMDVMTKEKRWSDRIKLCHKLRLTGTCEHIVEK